jgi:hypothetical protein
LYCIVLCIAGHIVMPPLFFCLFYIQPYQQSAGPSRHPSVGLPHMKLSSLFCPVKDHLGLRTPGVYRIPCECDRVYIGQTGRSVDIRLKSINGT